MLSTPAPFPQAGSKAFLRPRGEEVRIIQRRSDGACTIAVAEQFKRASSTRTVALADLAATQEEVWASKAQRRRKAA